MNGDKTTTSTTQSDAVGLYDSAQAQGSFSDGNVAQAGNLITAQIVGAEEYTIYDKCRDEAIND